MRKRIDEMELLASVFESSLDAKLIVFANGKVYRANRAAERVFLKKGEKDLKGKNVLTLLSGQSRENMKSFFLVMKQEHEVHKEIQIKVNDEWKVFDVTGHASIVNNMNLVILRDITDKAREREAREQFIAIAGHELKTPLAVISAYTDLLKRKHSDDVSMMFYLNKISGKNKVLTSYIESIMDEIRIGAGRFAFEDKEYKFDAIVKETIRELRKAYPKTKIVGNGKSGKKVNADRERVAQVIRNLVINAIKHSPRNKSISVEIKEKKATVYFSVQDRGRGVPIKEQTEIFKAFYRSGSKSAKSKSGLGLGLYIANRIVRQYKGTIGVESRVGKGAKFFFEIPFLEE